MGDRNSDITSIVHSGLENNAFFLRAPFGPEGGGALVFGSTSAGVPMTSLDIVAHEFMHGVTNASLRRRTGDGLGGLLRFDPDGPTSATFDGRAFSCNRTTFGERPAFCSGGRYTRVSNHAGAINEAFADMFGTATEFFFHTPGTGPLRADYLTGEDVSGLGPGRALDVPQSISVSSTTRSLPYPDRLSRRFSYIVVIAVGTRAAPIRLDIVPWVIFDGELLNTFGDDDGGVHINSTVLSHAFYLAIEGGRNATSGLTVQGVGAANRAQIEQVFFRAMTVLMPNEPRFSTARITTIQAARDLYGSGSGVERAVTAAWDAVGVFEQAVLSISFSPSPVITETRRCGTAPRCWVFRTTVQELNGIGFNVTRASVNFYNAKALFK